VSKGTPIELELSHVVKDSNIIVLVTYVEPFTEEVVVKTSDPTQFVPVFKKEGIIFNVKSVLKNTDKIEIPKTIRVPKSDWRRSLNIHKEKYAGGISKSYNLMQYKSEVKSMKHADILFLHHFQQTFELLAKNSFESQEALEKVTMLIAANK
jgi:hypothetical protein